MGWLQNFESWLVQKSFVKLYGELYILSTHQEAKLSIQLSTTHELTNSLENLLKYELL